MPAQKPNQQQVPCHATNRVVSLYSCSSPLSLRERTKDETEEMHVPASQLSQQEIEDCKQACQAD
jgi:hypothetical protein